MWLDLVLSASLCLSLLCFALSFSFFTLSLTVSKRCSVLPLFSFLFSFFFSILLTLVFVPCWLLSLFLLNFYDSSKDLSFPFCCVDMSNHVANNSVLDCKLNANHDEYICQTEAVENHRMTTGVTEGCQSWVILSSLTYLQDSYAASFLHNWNVNWWIVSWSKFTSASTFYFCFHSAAWFCSHALAPTCEPHVIID